MSCLIMCFTVIVAVGCGEKQYVQLSNQLAIHSCYVKAPPDSNTVTVTHLMLAQAAKCVQLSHCFTRIYL